MSDIAAKSATRAPDTRLTARLTVAQRKQLNEIHAATRVPLSELIRYFVDFGLDHYRRGRTFDQNGLVTDLAEHLHDTGASSQGRRSS